MQLVETNNIIIKYTNNHNNNISNQIYWELYYKIHLRHQHQKRGSGGRAGAVWDVNKSMVCASILNEEFTFNTVIRNSKIRNPHTPFKERALA